LPDAQPQYEAVQHYLSKVGINMEIEIIESTQHGALSRTTLYPVNTHRAIWGSEAVFNPFRVITAHTDRLAEEAMASPDEGLRYRNYARYFDYVVKEGRTIIYLQVDDIVAYDPEKLTDVNVSGFIDPMLRFIGIANHGEPDD
jgi:ABC-type transport system substrate-binding protein